MTKQRPAAARFVLVRLQTLLLTLCTLTACAPAMSTEDISRIVQGGTFSTVGDYKVGPGDMLSIKVFGEETLSGLYVVAPSGTVQFPLIGFMMVSGLGQVTIGQRLEQKLKPFIRDAKVVVSVNNSHSYMVFFSGEVAARGPRELMAKTTLLQGIIMAGGITDHAAGKIYLIRKVGDQDIRRYITYYKDLLRGTKALDFLYLERGDIIHVE